LSKGEGSRTAQQLARIKGFSGQGGLKGVEHLSAFGLCVGVKTNAFLPFLFEGEEEEEEED
jgi:hypothetical protein